MWGYLESMAITVRRIIATSTLEATCKRKAGDFGLIGSRFTEDTRATDLLSLVELSKNLQSAIIPQVSDTDGSTAAYVRCVEPGQTGMCCGTRFSNHGICRGQVENDRCGQVRVRRKRGARHP
jgi:hypothetical protein